MINDRRRADSRRSGRIRSGSAASVTVAAIAASCLCLVGAARVQAGRAVQDAPAQGFHYTRSIRDVERGWVRVPLGQEFVGKMMPDGSDVRVLDERGQIVPHAILGRDDEVIPIPARIIAVEAHDAGWFVTIDTELQPDQHALHDGLRFDFESLVTVPGVRLESSIDGDEWSDLATADLFRLGDASNLAMTGLDYPPSEARFLRVDWPESAGFPELEAVSVRPVALDKPIFEVEVDAVSIHEAQGRAEYRLFHPWLERAIELRVELDSGTAAFRLSAPSAGRWIERSQGILDNRKSGPSNSRILIPYFELQSTDVPRAPWRLELFAVGPTPLLEFERISSSMTELDLYFHADESVEYILAYGAADSALPGEPAARPSHFFSTVPVAELGAEVEHDLPRVDPASAPSGGPMPRARFAASWPIVADSVSPGDVVQLELPDEVFGQSAAGFMDLRIDVADRQVPYLQISPSDPALVFESGELAPESLSATRGRRQSAVAFDVPAALPLSELEILAGDAAFERQMTVEWVDGGEGFDGLADPDQGRRLIETTTWRCEARSPVPCRIAISLWPDRARRIQIRFDDGDNVPLDSISVKVWRRRESIRFAWPEAGAPVLRVGAMDVTFPDYDLTAIEGALRSLPAVEATLGEREPLTGLPGASAAAERANWLPTAGLGLTALVMLGLLWRLMRSPATVDE